MALAGTDSALAGKLKAAIEKKLGKAAMKSDLLQALCEAIAETVLPHIVQNADVTVSPGIAVATAGGPGATTSPGMGKVK